MKRYIRSSTIHDPYASSLGYSDDEQTLIYSWVAQLQKEAKTNLPQVEMEINSFNLDRDTGILTLTGDMTYKGDNRWLDIKVSIDGKYNWCVYAYLEQVKLAYGMTPFEGTELEQLANNLDA